MKFDLGCGTDKKKGCIGVDIKKHTNADLFADMEHFPYPFKDNSADEIWLWGVLEHLFYPHNCINEVHRTLKPNGVLHLNVPFFQPTHSGTGTHYDHKDYFRYTEHALRRMLKDFTKLNFSYRFGKFRLIYTAFMLPKVSMQRHWEKLLDGLDMVFKIKDRRIPRNIFVEAVK